MLDFSIWTKVIFVTDNHLCSRSSVISGQGQVFSDRLENQIECIKWVNSFNLPVIHLGDFTDKALITAEEQTCLDILKPYIRNWIFLRGNHEYAGDFDVLGALNGTYIRKPTEANIGGLRTLFLPFNSKEEDIKDTYDLILGHIGIEGIPFGAKGFKFDIIDKACRIFLNGHLHNRLELGKDKWNMGSLTAQNFSDNDLDYRKGLVYLDTKTGYLEFIENPYAFNFYKFTWADYLRKYKDTEVGMAIRSKNSCISMTCKEGEKSNILESREFSQAYYLRIAEDITSNKVKESKVAVGQLDHLEKFRTSFIDKAGDNQIVLEELAEVLK